ncbi:MAG: VWA domain-containing protein [Candidatus Acidiferrales bacterium]
MRTVRASCLAASFILTAAITVSAQQPAPASPPATAPSTPPSSDSPLKNVPLRPQSQAPQPTQTQQQLPPLKVTTGLVHLVAAVTDRRHNFITDLDEKDFRVLEDGKPQDIRFFGRDTDLPLRIGMLIDTSNSIRERLSFEKDAAIDFLGNVIRRHKDMAFLMTFDNEPEIIQDFSGDPGVLDEAIEKQRAGGGTALNDAIYMAAQKLSSAPLPTGPSPEVRRILVVISDGDDNLSDRALSEAIEMADRAEVAIYSISTSTDWLATTSGDKPHKLFKTPGDQILENFAIETGGRVFFPYKVDDLAESFQDIGAELRSQYFIAYAPSNTAQSSQYRKIQVEIVDRKGLVVRTRKGYYPNETPTPSTPPSQ